GAIGYRSPVAGLELNVAIRTFEFRDGRIWLGSGGGLTPGPGGPPGDPGCPGQGGPPGRALRAPPRGAARPAATPPPPRAGGVPRGRCRDLDAHLGRLDASTRELFGKPLPPGLPGELAACLARRPSGRLRITAKPAGGPLQVTIEVVPADATPVTVALRPVTI